MNYARFASNNKNNIWNESFGMLYPKDGDIQSIIIINTLEEFYIMEGRYVSEGRYIEGQYI